jgi:hypothetical protein
MSSTEPNAYTYLVGKRDEQGTFWCWGEFSNEEKARASYELTCIDYPGEHIELIQQIMVNKVVETHYPKRTVVPVLEHYWQIEYEDRDTDFPGWNSDEDDRFCSVSQAIEEAKKLALVDGEFFKRFRVVEVFIETKITTSEVAVFETEDGNTHDN